LAWTIEYLSASRKQLKRFDPLVRKRIVSFMGERVATSIDPRSLGEPLAGEWKGLWRYRVGDFRIICKIEAEKVVVQVVKVGHRSSVYER